MRVKEALERYREMLAEIDRRCAELRRRYNPRMPCGYECNLCCLNTATLFISAVEAFYLREGIERLPKEVRNAVFEGARRASRRILELGKHPRDLTREEAVEILRGRGEGICPLLIGGVCACYDHRPIICRLWGYPIDTGGRVVCCEKTFPPEKLDELEPIPYHRYWEEAQRLSRELLGFDRSYPMCYMILTVCYLPLKAIKPLFDKTGG